MSGCRHLKSPDAVLDYVEDWSVWLDGDTIATSQWQVAIPGLSITEQAKSVATATVWLSGGQQGRQYKVTNTITTAGGRTASRSITVIIHQL